MILLGFILTPEGVTTGLEVLREIRPRLAAQDDLVRLLKTRGWSLRISHKWVGDGAGSQCCVRSYTVDFARYELDARPGQLQVTLVAAREHGRDLPSTIRLAALSALELEQLRGGGGSRQ